MTNKRAIEILSARKKYLREEAFIGNMPLCEAIDVAVKALNENDRLHEELKKYVFENGHLHCELRELKEGRDKK